MNIVVGVADLKVSDSNQDVIITYSLGSCLGIAMHDAHAGVGGVLHCMLPLSKIDFAKAENNPAMFVDTGMNVFLQTLFNLGAQRCNLVTKVAGGAQILDENKTFNIGERNYTVLRKVLWKNNILISGEEVGGNIPRTLSLDIGTGRTKLKSQGHEREL